jgi:hypothetical protein
VPFLTRATLLVALASFVSGPAFAAPCGAADFTEAFPADGAKGVPSNATLSAHYAATATYDGEEISLEHGGADTESLIGDFDAAEGLLGVTPSAPLVAGDTYTLKWPRLRAVGGGSRGRGATVSFTAGDVTDVAPPDFDGLTALAWDVRREHDDCTDSLEDRFAFDLSLGPASDDGGRALLTLVVFQSRGPQIAAKDGPVKVLTTALPAKGAAARVERALEDATGHVCFAALVRDLTGAVSAGADREVCATTVAPPFFYGCGISRGRGSGAGAWLVVGAMLLLRRRALGVP